ncbi:hypothetical protein C8K18_10716 [Paraburkholderia sp. GV068]|uniref:hypothetical protein n=1 Tax=unclassified Paraburkholderia TaxID=2615204 RepID=UPI000D312BEB|nr:MULTISPECIES: hypothetical protein [unclassified Paraburkholderia]PTQ98434.1 hypothetical protein C8K19_10716 [Paraburkholderia sp. GV072]PUB03677.1 hypothetical protein C8K18_10716 [Paraburkholderia sp. GV068]
MTFILAVVHKDMSILAADRQGNASGTGEFTIGQMKLKVTAPKITINGIKKISLNRSKEFAVGIAGTYADHPYMSTVEACDDLRASFEAVTTHASRYNFDADKKPIMQGGAVMGNQSIASYFDDRYDSFFSTLFQFTPMMTSSATYYATRPGAGLMHVGSGSQVFESAVGVESIEDFKRSIADKADPTFALNWLAEAFRLVSEKADGCGSDFVAVAATRDTRRFADLKVAP